MLGYGIDPRPEAVSAELTDQLLSERKLPFEQMTGGYASHIGLSPVIFADAPDAETKGIALRDPGLSARSSPPGRRAPRRTTSTSTSTAPRTCAEFWLIRKSSCRPGFTSCGFTERS